MESAPRFTVEAEISAIADAWDELATRTRALPFLWRDWFEAWSAAFAPGSLQVATLTCGGELVALLPLQARGKRLISASNWHTPVYGPLALDDDAGAELLGQLFSVDARTIELSFLDATGGGLDQAARAAHSAGRAIARRTLMRSPFVALEGSYEDYERGLSKNRRKGLRRGTRALEREGSLTFEIDDGRGDLEARLREAFAVEASGWKGERGTAISSSEETHRFYVELARHSAARNWLRLAFLRLDGRALAFDLALEHAGAWYSLKAGYEHSAARFGPGGVLLAMELRRCYENGLERFELLGNADEFKLSFANQVRELGWLGAYAPSPSGRAEASVVWARERLRPAARRLTRRS
jgi:CelD/BcsL family acetyltransferase involved in cellulose biosynthesis